MFSLNDVFSPDRFINIEINIEVVAKQSLADSAFLRIEASAAKGSNGRAALAFHATLSISSETLFVCIEKQCGPKIVAKSADAGKRDDIFKSVVCDAGELRM